MAMASRNKRRRMRTLHALQYGLCAHCANPLIHPDEARANGRLDRQDSPTLDHVTPQASGGSNALTNLILAHRSCNQARQRRPLGETAKAVWQANLARLAEAAART